MKLKHIIYMGAWLLTVTSCSDYLNEPPADLLASDGFYQTTAQADQGVMGIYSDLRYLHLYDFWYMSEVRSDNIWVNPEPNGQRDYSDIGTFRAGSELGTFESTWNAWYKLIYDANVAISKLSSAELDNTTVQTQLLNEAHFLRGWAYFELVRLYGSVPMVTEPSSPSTVNQLAQTAGKEVIEQVVIPDLEAALNLPDKGKILDATGTAVPEQGRADCTAAAAMLARVYMTLAGYPYNESSATAKAKTYLTQVLAKKDTYWAKDINEWRKQWTADGANLYSIFAIQYRAGGTGNPALFNITKVLPASYLDNKPYRTPAFFGNDIFIEKSLFYEFDQIQSSGNKDLRGEGWSYLSSYAAESNTDPYQSAVEALEPGSSIKVNSESMVYKYTATKPKLDELGLTFDFSTIKDYNDWPINYSVIRIEDMMLLYAEILTQEGNLTEAMKYVNEIRERAGCDAVSASNATEALNYVKRERRLELFGEGIRWFDEVRYGTWKEDILNKFARYSNPSGTSTSDVADGRYLYPIPANQMAITPGLYQQNTGY